MFEKSYSGKCRWIQAFSSIWRSKDWSIKLVQSVFQLQNCAQPVMDHAVIEVTYPDQSVEMLSMGMNNYMLLHIYDRHYIIRGKSFHENSVDLEVVQTTFITDSAANEFNILKRDSQIRHFAVGKSSELIGYKSEIAFNVKEVIAMKKGTTPQKVCYAHTSCCTATYYALVCCSGGTGPCKYETCDCQPPMDCGNDKPSPDIHDLAKLFSREKVNVKVSFN